MLNLRCFSRRTIWRRISSTRSCRSSGGSSSSSSLIANRRRLLSSTSPPWPRSARPAADTSFASTVPLRSSSTHSAMTPHCTRIGWLSTERAKYHKQRAASSCVVVDSERHRCSRGDAPPNERIASCISKSSNAMSHRASAAAACIASRLSPSSSMCPSLDPCSPSPPAKVALSTTPSTLSTPTTAPSAAPSVLAMPRFSWSAHKMCMRGAATEGSISDSTRPLSILISRLTPPHALMYARR